MFNGSFENSLRNGSYTSPNSPKNQKPHQHTSCKGAAHGTGTYIKDGAFQRTPSKRYTKPPKIPPSEKKSTSVSSEGFSESDSLDSLGEKTKTSQNNNSVDKNEVSSRLYTSTTKASVAKTAKMRHLDIFDVEDCSWPNALRKNKIKKMKKVLEKSKRKKIFENVVDYTDVAFFAENKKFLGFFRSLDLSLCFKNSDEFTTVVSKILSDLI